MAIITPEKVDIHEEDIQNKGAVSEDLLRKFGSSLNAVNYYAMLPLGTIIENFLPKTVFQAIASSAWAPLDGSDVSLTDYGQLLINNALAASPVYLPDGRGMEFVQVNDGRSDGHENSEEVGAGEFQDQRLLAHRHHIVADTTVGYTTGRPSSSQQIAATKSGSGAFSDPPSTNYAIAGTSDDATRGRTSSVGDNQTNSKRIAVYRYIKVWNVAPDL